MSKPALAPSWVVEPLDEDFADDAPTAEVIDRRLTAEQLWFASRISNLDKRRAWIRYQMAAGHRRWWICSSEGVLVLAVTSQIIQIEDYETRDLDEAVFRLYAHQYTERGVHLYFPSPLSWAPPPDARGYRLSWGPSKDERRSLRLTDKRRPDGRYAAWSNYRRYYHERPRHSPIIVPVGCIGPPEWPRVLMLHQRWHAYAAQYAGEHGQTWPWVDREGRRHG